MNIVFTHPSGCSLCNVVRHNEDCFENTELPDEAGLMIESQEHGWKMYDTICIEDPGDISSKFPYHCVFPKVSVNLS